MEHYDVVSIGGGIAGSIAARLAAEAGLKSLLVERAKTPRDKPCSGIQFGYFEKLVGRTIPPEALCQNEIYKMNIITPDGETYSGKMKVLNFWRSTFDRWLNDLAVEEGAFFQDKTRMIDYKPADDGYLVHLFHPCLDSTLICVICGAPEYFVSTLMAGLILMRRFFGPGTLPLINI